MSAAEHPAWVNGSDRFRTLYHLLTAISRARNIEELYEAAISSLIESTSADRAAILLFDDDGVIRFKASRGISPEYQAAVTGHTPWPRGTMNATPIVVPDVLLAPDLASFQDVFRAEGIRALAFVPLALDDGVMGKFMLYYSRPHECSLDELEIASTIAAHIALATERKRAELARARTEYLFQTVVDNSTAVIFLKDVQGRYLLVNRRFEELFHISKADVIGLTNYDLFPREAADQYAESEKTVLQTGAPVTLEERAPQDDGVHTYVSVKFPLCEPDGSVSGICCIGTDITELKRLESASRHLAAIVENSDAAIVSKDLNGVVTSWNQAAERMFGYTAAEAIGRPIASLTSPHNTDEMPSILNRLRRGERIENYETLRRCKDGRIIDVALTISPVRDAKGNIVGASKIARDITQLKAAERERSGLLAREREARRVAELLNRFAPRLAAQLDINALVQEVTDISTVLLGAEFGLFLRESALDGGSSTLYAISGTPPPGIADLSLTEYRDLFRSTLQGQKLVRWAAEPSSNSLLRSYLAMPIMTRSGELLGGLFFGDSLPGKFTEAHEAILRGIAAQAATAMDNARLFEQSQWVQTELKRSNEELRRANQDLEIFAYSASHDLQEPLRTISISAELIERNLGPEMKGAASRFLGSIITASQRMTVLIDDLLTYTKATKYEAGPPPAVDSAQVLAGVLESLRATIENTGAVITSGALPKVAIHESRLAQLFQNLISNAIKYRNQKEVPRVHIAADERNGWCVFSVVDNGIGIEPQYAERIFGLFKRLHGRDEYPGSGIGLAICQRVVEQYGGRIWLDHSTPGEGSTFSFSLPSSRH